MAVAVASVLKWRETKQQLSWCPDLALLGCCLVSLHFLWNILSSRPVLVYELKIWTYCSIQSTFPPRCQNANEWGSEWVTVTPPLAAPSVNSTAKLPFSAGQLEEEVGRIRLFGFLILAESLKCMTEKVSSWFCFHFLFFGTCWYDNLKVANTNF